MLANQRTALVGGEPLSVYRGLGLFDDLKLLVGAYLQFPGVPEPQFSPWGLAERLEVRRSWPGPADSA